MNKMEEDLEFSNFEEENDFSVDEEDEHPDLSRNEKKRKKENDNNENESDKKKKKFENNLYKQPTVEELQQLRETKNLFHSNLFRLQIEELLNEVKLKDNYKKLFNDWLINFKEKIMSIEDVDCLNLDSSELNVRIPLLNLPKEAKEQYKYLKPLDIEVIGSYPLGTIIGPIFTIDVAIQMPSKLFQNKDYQNCRYMKKKAMYLAYIASNIDKTIAEEKTFIGNELRPILKIIPPGKLAKKVVLNVYISVEEETFKLIKFSPEKSNIRANWLYPNEANEDEPFWPTSHYNSIILSDLIMNQVNSQSLDKIRQFPNIRDGIILLKIWLKQREITKDINSFNGHIITMYVLYLLQMKKLNTYMSSYQIVRNVWMHLAQSDWTTQGITMCTFKSLESNIYKYHEYYDCVFLDSTSHHNFTAFITKDTFFWVKREAEVSLNNLNNIHIDSFQSLFIKKLPFYMAFDNLITIHDTTAIKNMVKTKVIKDKLDIGISMRSRIINVLIYMLKKGLGKRIKRICVAPCEYKEWKCVKKIPSNIGTILIGLELDPEFCFGIVEKGPVANLPEAIEFRKFWGSKSELRRFPDGLTCEAVVWGKGKTLYGRRGICKRIVNFLLLEKLNLSDNDYTYIADQFDEVLLLNALKITQFSYGTGEEATLKAIQTFDDLEKEITSLNDVPLPISGVHGYSPVFRYTEVFPPLATTYKPNETTTIAQNHHLILNEDTKVAPTYAPSIEACLQLSTSGKWPDDLEAIRKTKAAFHIQIAKAIRRQYKLIAQGNHSHIDVFKNGFVFRLSIAHQKEIAFMKQQIGDDGVVKYRDTEESIKLETKLFLMPKLSSALHGLHLQQPSFGVTCCIAKRWLSAQLLDESHIPGIVVELLIASIYLNPEPFSPTQSPQIAFLRLLNMFISSSWSTDPVIVNFNDEMSKEEIAEVETLFGTSRNSLPPLFISIPYDQQKSLFTKKAPSEMILDRISRLAKSSLQLFESQILKQAVIDIKPIFRPPLKDFDCLIYLEPKVNPRRIQAIDLESNQKMISWHPYKTHSKQKMPVIDFDPVQKYLETLRNAYSELALFFHDTYGGMVIAVLLKPDALKPVDFKVSRINCRKLTKDGKLIINITAMIQDFYILGKDIVKAIDVPSKQSIL